MDVTQVNAHEKIHCAGVAKTTEPQTNASTFVDVRCCKISEQLFVLLEKENLKICLLAKHSATVGVAAVLILTESKPQDVLY